ncbi:MAG: tetratricopeptide repeat protein [Planctomycetota bacterium]
MSRSPAIVCVALAAAVMSGCASSSSPEAEVQTSRFADIELPPGGLGLFVEASLASRRGEEELAVDLLRRAVAADDNLIVAYRMMGELLLARGDATEAVEAFTVLVERDPNTARSYVLLGDSLSVLGRYSAALNRYLTALQLEPDNLGANLGAGTSLVALDRADEATTYLSTAVNLDPRSAAAWRQTAMAMLAVGQLEQASQAIDRLLELTENDNPRRPEDLLLAADVAGARFDARVAEDLLAQVRRLRPNDAEPVRRLVLLHLRLGERFLGDGQDAQAAAAYESAEEAIGELLLILPEDAEAWSTLGSARLRLWDIGGRIDDSLRQAAIDAWERSLELDPEQADVRRAVEQFGR